MQRSKACAGTGAPCVRGWVSFALFAVASTGCAGDVSESEALDRSAQSLDATLEVEAGVRTGMLDRSWGAIMDGAGDRVCWSGVAMAGIDRATLRYSNGEGANDRVDLTYNGQTLASLALPYCVTGGAWDGQCGEASVTFAAPAGSGTLCLVGAGPNWIGALDRLVLGGSAPVVPGDGTSDGTGDGAIDPEPPPAAELGDIVPLFGVATALEPDVTVDTPSALVTRFADRGRDRHARESAFQAYEHYLTFYWEDRTAVVTITDPIGKGGREIRFDVVTQHKLGARELRMGFMGQHTVAEYCDNGTLTPAYPDGREMPIGEYDASPVDGLHYYFKIVRQHYTPITCATAPLAKGQKIEFELSQFLDAPRNGRSNYYGTTYLYVVGEGIKAWEASGALGNPSGVGMYGTSADSVPIPAAALLGGRTTTHRNESNEPANVFMQLATNLAPQNGQRFMLGRRLVHTDFASGAHDEAGNPVWNEQRGKAGPLYIQHTCNGCHAQNGRALPPAVGQPLEKWVFKVGDASGQPDPRLGAVLQPSSTVGDGEGVVTLGPWNESGGLRTPTFAFAGVVPARYSARISPQLVGIGLLEAIPESALLVLADPDDQNGDGISGRAHVVRDQRGVARLGRFGWKAAQPDVSHQVAAALRTDLGVLSSLFPTPDCGAAQSGCGPSGAELADAEVAQLATYTSLLGVPPQLNHASAEVQSGSAVFQRIGCTSCHAATFQTSPYAPFAELRNQTIHPYTDLLLHDLGPGLAASLGEGSASGAEWRTAPLWGVGKTLAMHGAEAYLHDGRARSLDEAIRWHGGEAQAVTTRYVALAASERAALLAFLRSL